MKQIISTLFHCKPIKKRYLFFFFVVYLYLIILLSVCLAKFISPKEFPYLGFISLGFPVLLLGYMILWVISLSISLKRGIIVFFFSLFLYFPCKNIWGPILHINPPQGKKLSALSYNIHYGYEGLEDVEAYLDTLDIDIIFLQEIYSRQWKDTNAFLPHRHNAIYSFVGISSKYPIVNSNTISFDDTNGYACYADIVIDTDTIRAISLYLESNYINKRIINLDDSDAIENTTYTVSQRLIRAYTIHEYQLQILSEFIEQTPYPILLGADGNSVPNSYEFYTLTNYLNDAHSNAGTGMGSTFEDYYYPLRIDYIFYDTSFFEAIDCKVLDDNNLSDHNPVKAELILQEKP